MSTLAIRLKEIRSQKKLTQEELAKILKTNRGTLANWENNRSEPDADTIRKIAKTLGVSTDYLLGITDDPTETVEPMQEQKKPKDLQKFLDQQEIMFDGVPLTEDDKEKIRKALELIFWDAKQKNKRKKS